MDIMGNCHNIAVSKHIDDNSNNNNNILNGNFDDLQLFTFNNQLHQAKVVDVYDGDTITIVIIFRGEQSKYKFRMLGYDSPEMKPRLNIENRDLHIQAASVAKKFLKQYLNKIIWIKFTKEDKYGRLMGNVYEDSKLESCINQKMISKGLGKEYDGGKKSQFTQQELTNIVENIDV